jgi:membrane-bound metal-dependent hydrolase YbcI (DUF457 family)
MMGRNHSIVGMATWLAAGPASFAAAGHPLTTEQSLAGVLLCAGASLLPDIDHPQSTVARTLGPVTQLPAAAIASIAGGHRQKTHTILFCALMGPLAAWVIAQWKYGLFGMYMLFAAWAIRLLLPDTKSLWGGLGPAVLAAAAAWAAADVPAGAWVPLAVVFGALAHLVGDMLTPGGVPILLPFSKKRFAMPLFTTGTAGEQVFSLFAFAAVLWMAWAQYGDWFLALRPIAGMLR